MSKGKRYNEKQTNILKLSTIIKILLLVLVIITIVIAIYYFFIHEHISSDNTNNIQVIYETSEIVSTSEPLVVKGAEYLEIIGVYINSDNPKRSTVSTKIKNNSNETHENIELSITLLDKNDKTITTLDCKINNLEPNEETVTYTALMEDLSNCINYFITIKQTIYN